jgi:hypothetical protein
MNLRSLTVSGRLSLLLVNRIKPLRPTVKLCSLNESHCQGTLSDDAATDS